jgi:polar amino acid transport system permease protein
MSNLNIGAWSDDLLNGLWVTVYITFLGAIAALVIAFVLGLLAQMKARFPRAVARIVIEFFRGTSLLVQLFWLYYALPLLGYQLDAVEVAVVAFGLNFGAYGAEIVRGAIKAVPRAQWEGAIALNLSPYQRMRRVILPQAYPLMIPPFGNLLIQLIKSTPLVFLITLTDLTTVADQYRSSEGHEAFIFGLLLVVYFVFAYVCTIGMHALEALAKARLGQREKPREILAFRGPMEEEGGELA